MDDLNLVFTERDPKLMKSKSTSYYRRKLESTGKCNDQGVAARDKSTSEADGR